jgi:hypothetical protein
MSHVLVWIENAGRNVSKKQGIASKNSVNLSAATAGRCSPLIRSLSNVQRDRKVCSLLGFSFTKPSQTDVVSAWISLKASAIVTIFMV